MRRNDHMARRFLAVFLASVLAYGNFGIQVALGVEAAGGSVDVAEKVAEAQPAETESAAQAEEPAAETEDESQPEAKAAPQAVDNPTPVPAPNDDTSNDGDPAPAAETLPYSIEVTFDGHKLKDGENNIDDVWTTGSKILNVKLTRNKKVDVDPNKQYVLCMSVPTALYFSGLPEADKINGVESVAIVKNTMPTLNATLRKDYTYELSAYSGQIRMLLNTTVDNVEIADQSILFDPKLVGYKVSGNTTITGAPSIRVVAVDKGTSLDAFSDSSASKIVSREVSTLQISNGERLTSDGSLRMRLSSDGFVNESMTGGDVKISKDGNIVYALESGQKNAQVYSKLKVVMHCPYIVVNGARHYLSFKLDDSALNNNRVGGTSGPKMTGDAVYDAQAHTITYTFENVYLAAWQVIAVSPQFYWPEDLDKTIDIPDNGILVKREARENANDGWELPVEKTFCDYDTTLLPTNHGGGPAKATYMPDYVDVQIKSSAEDVANSASAGSSKLGQRLIYKGVTRANGVEGGIAFFDIHNYGVVDSPSSTITFEFNTDGGTGAKYYVTRVNAPGDGYTKGVDVNYELVNDAGNVVSGTKHYEVSTSFYVYASQLRLTSKVDSTYYIKKISYKTETLRKNGQYHTEVTHGRRNFNNDSGLVLGYMEGNVGQTACATLTIESDGGALNKGSDTKLVSTETSTIGNDDSITYGFNTRPSFDGNLSKSITAGGTATLSFSSIISNAEDQTRDLETDALNIGTLNGYHILRDPIVYVCLPEGVSIAGVDQATVTHSGNTSKAMRVSQLANSECTYEGVKAVWWEVRYENVNIDTRAGTFRLQLSTSSQMAGVSWNFEKAIAVRAYGQAYKTTGTTDGSSAQMNTLTKFKSVASGNTMLSALAAGLEGDAHANKLGLAYYTYGVNTTLNISRAEAKLDVDAKLSMGSTVSRDLKVTDADSKIRYEVNVSSTDGGSAENFNYYIPIAKQSAKPDANSFVVQQDYNLQLKKAVEITELSGANAAIPFEVLYTTKTGLDSAEVAELEDGTDDPSVGWVDEADLGGNFGAVTAVLIRTPVETSVAADSHYRFNVTLGYDNTYSDFASQAGRSVVWRSFGHYTYNRNGAATTNTYPSQDNLVKLGYVADLTASDPIDVAINTGADTNVVPVNQALSQTFVNAQTMKIKSVTVSNGTTLVSEDPAAKTGAEANSQFMMQFGINAGATGMTTLSKGYSGGNYTVASGVPMVLMTRTLFSKALTDNSTPRNAVVQFGNDDVDIKVQINLIRTVAPVEVTGSGTAEGEQFAAANVNRNAINVPSNAAFTALYDIKNFITGNFTAQKLVWRAAGAETALPTGTKITMLVLGSGADNSVKSWWLYTVNGTESSVNLNKFKRMGGSDNFAYDTSGSTGVQLKYQFVVSFPESCTTEGSFSLGFAADPKTGAAAFATDDLPVNLVSRASFGLDVNGQMVSYTYTPAGSRASDSRTSGKLLALVLTPKSSSDVLPADAKVTAAGVSYAKNVDGNFIVPLSTASTGSVELGLTSEMASTSGGNYGFDVSLMLYSATAASEDKGAAPQAGFKVDASSVTLSVAASTSPSLKVTGKRVATKAQWTAGCDFVFDVKDLPADAVLTVDAYSGLTGTSSGARVTDLLSNVGSRFSIANGTGTYDRSKTGSNTLTLSSAAKAGTYHLVFKITDASGNEVMSVPYYIVVRE